MRPWAKCSEFRLKLRTGPVAVWRSGDIGAAVCPNTLELGCAKPRNVVPHLLQVLQVVLPRARCVAEHVWGQFPFPCQYFPERNVGRSAVVGVTSQHFDRQAEAWVPLNRTRQSAGQRFNLGVQEAG